MNTSKYTKQEMKALTLENGYKWSYYDNGKHAFVSGNNREGFKLINATDDDIENGNIQFMAKYGISNENKQLTNSTA